MRIKSSLRSCSDFSNDYQFNGIDVVKFICAYLVCIIHIQPFNAELLGVSWLNDINFGLQQCLCRIAVPFYFTASGFLIFRKIDFNNFDYSRIKNYCFKILRLLGTWIVLLFVGGSGQLWYLGAVVVAVVLLSICIKKKLSMWLIFAISIVLYIIGMLGDSYYIFIEPLKSSFISKLFITGRDILFSESRDGIFIGILFVFLGMLFAKKRIILNNVVAIIGLIVSIALLFAEVFWLKSIYSYPQEYTMLIMLLPTVFFLFYLATHIKLKNRAIYKKLRIIGMLVFFMHFLGNFVAYIAILALNKTTGISLFAFQFIFAVIITTLMAITIERLSHKEKFHLLKYLYS